MLYHKHRCYYCGTIWEHGENCAGVDGSHNCPDCGKSHEKNFHRIQGELPTFTGSCLNLWEKGQRVRDVVSVNNMPIISQYELAGLPIAV